MSNPVRFTLEIDMGNDAMQFKRHAANALEKTAHMIKTWAIPCDAASGSVLDTNGNKVGEWKFHYE